MEMGWGWEWGGLGDGVGWWMGWVGGFALTPRDGITPSPTELSPFVPPGCPASPHCFSSWARSRSAAWRVGRWSRRASTRALLWAAKVGGGREKWDPLPPLPPSSHPPSSIIPPPFLHHPTPLTAVCSVGLYCSQCYATLNNVCSVCMGPLSYKDMGDEEM